MVRAVLVTACLNFCLLLIVYTRPLRVVDKLVQLCFVCLVGGRKAGRQANRNTGLFMAHLTTNRVLTFSSLYIHLSFSNRLIWVFIGADISSGHAARRCVKPLKVPQLSAVEDWYVSLSPSSVLNSMQAVISK